MSTERAPQDPAPTLTDIQLKIRTEQLLASAERISQQLAQQTERLAAAIDQFDKEIIAPLRERTLKDYD